MNLEAKNDWLFHGIKGKGHPATSRGGPRGSG